MSDAPVLAVRNLETFYGPIQAIRGVSIEVPAGRIVTVLGANGAGKTTLLRTISGVAEPRKGEIALAGQRIDGSAPDRIAAAGIGHVPEGREVFPLLSVEENLRLGAFRRAGRRAVAADLDLVYDYFPALRARRRQLAGTLSGGQQQMLAIGRGLMARPSLMLLDEPSLGLSPLLVREIFAILARLNREQGVTMLLVEQNAAAALAVADFGYVMELGRVVLAGEAARLRSAEDIREFYLGQGPTGVRGEKRWKRRKTWR